MENKNGKWKVMALLALILGGISCTMIVYAAYTRSLEITGQAKVMGPDWNIHFENLQDAVVTENGTADGTPTLKDASITNVKAVFDGKGTVSYTFDVKNSGIIDARIGTLTKLTATCTGSGENKTVDEALVCDNLTTTLTYSDGVEVKEADTLTAGEVKTMKLTISYDPGEASVFQEVNVTGIGVTIIYNEN